MCSEPLNDATNEGTVVRQISARPADRVFLELGKTITTQTNGPSVADPKQALNTTKLWSRK